MAVTKPNMISQSASMYEVKRAKDARGRSMAQNAALGLDNFARLLQDDPAAAQNFMPQSRGAGLAADADFLRAAGFENAQPFMLPSPGLPGAGGPQPGQNLRAMSAAQKAMQISRQPLAMAAQGFRGLDSARPLGGEGAALALKTAAHKLKAAAETAVEVVEGSLGHLSSLFESGREGVAAIGYDKVGGTSYGAYQIASGTGTFEEFLRYLDEHAPDYAKELRQAGEANTGGKSGAAPEAWRAIAARDPEGFGALQHGFIEEKLYAPAARSLGEQGVSEARLSPALREVLFSTAVQHGAGGAASIVGRALQGVKVQDLLAEADAPGVDKSGAEELAVRRIYEIRQRQFGSSSPQVREAVTNRLNSEMQAALGMLKGGAA